MAAEDHFRPNVEPRRTDAQQRMHGKALAARAVVARRTEDVGADERPPLEPPERDFGPTPPLDDADHLERAERLERHDVVRYSEPPGDRGAVTVVPVEKLDDADDVLELVDAWVVDGIDQPRAALRGEGVRATFHELVLDPLRYGNHNSAQRSTCGKPFARAAATRSSTLYGMLRNSTASVSSSTIAYSQRRAVPIAPTQNHNVRSKRRSHC